MPRRQSRRSVLPVTAVGIVSHLQTDRYFSWAAWFSADRMPTVGVRGSVVASSRLARVSTL